MNGLLEGRVAVITGGGRGIGLACVELFVEHGCRVVVGDLRDDEGRLGARFGKAVLAVRVDVTDDAQVGGLIETAVRAFGRLDIMVNNAGAAGRPVDLVSTSTDDARASFSLLVESVLSGHRYAAEQFIRQGGGGSIISVASAAAVQGGWATPSYTIAKHAVLGVVRSAAAELSSVGIRSNVISPGFILTPIMSSAYGVDEMHAAEFNDYLSDQLRTAQPLNRVGRPEDVAGAALFLASDLSTFMTGTVIPVDGGATAVDGGDLLGRARTAARGFKESLAREEG